MGRGTAAGARNCPSLQSEVGDYYGRVFVTIKLLLSVTTTGGSPGVDRGLKPGLELNPTRNYR